MNWAREIALKIINERNLDVYTVASGVSPSGYVHIGNFREIATPYLVAMELKKLGKRVRYILSFDEYDRFRKVPGNIDPSYEKFIGLPYTSIPYENETYASYMENRFLNELKQMDIDVECIYQTKEYKSGRYNEYIKLALDKRAEIFDIIDSFRTQDAETGEKEAFYPISIYCHKCGKDSTKVLNYENGLVTYECVCGHHETIDVLSQDNIKLQWKVDWPMRWMVENVTFETGGADHSAANGSKAVAERISREIFNFEPPIYLPYNFIGIKGGGAKMSSSKGNVLTLTDLLKVYDKNIIWWFYARFDPMHAFDIALDNDVIRYYQEYDRMVKSYYEDKLDYKNKTIIELTNPTKDYLNNPNFSYIATFLPIVNFNEDNLKVLLNNEHIDTTTNNYQERLARAKYWVNNYGVDYQIKLLETKNIDYYNTLTPREINWVNKTINLFNETYNSSDEINEVLYDVVKEDLEESEDLKQIQKRYYQILYNLLLGTDKGPKLGLFLIAVEREKIISLLK